MQTNRNNREKKHQIIEIYGGGQKVRPVRCLQFAA